MDMPGMEYVGKEDLPALREFARPIWTETFYPMMPRHSADFVFDAWVNVENLSRMIDEGYRMGYVLEHGERVGWFAFSVSGDTLHISKLYLRGDSEGKGIGSRILNAMMDIARSEGASRADLNVYRTNERAKRTYERNGFVEIRREVEQLTEDVVRDDIVYGRPL